MTTAPPRPPATRINTPRTAPAWPRPTLVHDHRTLFLEPAYEDGQPYDDEDDEDDD
ncbi:hypothetical protein [Streptomyces seoulensis]|uniref:hypothetical protein n=1 Tax=Streptomyces seoulensis TaxID=73044 RepID=UPI000A6FF3F5|nr:hypothetical protein [Streptomyces seoulensis]